MTFRGNNFAHPIHCINELSHKFPHVNDQYIVTWNRLFLGKIAQIRRPLKSGLKEKNGDYIYSKLYEWFINSPATSAEPSEASDWPELKS